MSEIEIDIVEMLEQGTPCNYLRCIGSTRNVGL
jgi:hypothetical protein